MLNRRVFLKSAAAAGTLAALSGLENLQAKQKPDEKNSTDKKDPNDISSLQKNKLPSRTLGKTGVKIPCLGLGTNRLDNQALIRAHFSSV